MGLYSLFTSEKYMNPGLLADAFGNIPGDLIDTGNRMLKPVTNYVGTYVNMWERIFEEKPMETWLAMNKWVNDGPPSLALRSGSGSRSSTSRTSSPGARWFSGAAASTSRT